MVAYSSHDWRKNTDNAIVKDNGGGGPTMRVNECHVIFTNPKTLKEETVDVSRLVRVFVNNRDDLKRSVK